MKEALPILENLTTVAFLILGVVTAVGWLRNRANSLGFLALAIVLLSAVTLLGRISGSLHAPPQLLSDISLVGFMGSGYALVRYRSALIPLGRTAHTGVVVALLATTVTYLLISSMVDSAAEARYKDRDREARMARTTG